jgi:hypothetical protein
MKHYCWQLLMIYLLRSNASNALAIGGKKGASAATAGGGAGVANHLVAVTRGRSAAGNRRRTISNIFDHYGGGSRSDGISNNSSTSSSSTTLHQTSYNHNHHHHSERQGQLNRTPLIHKGGYICFRLARKSDVPQIQNCNLGKTTVHILSLELQFIMLTSHIISLIMLSYPHYFPVH